MEPDLSLLDELASDLEPIVGAFRSGGFEVHLVGGLVRDLVGGRPIDVVDVDLATDAEPAQIRAVLDGRVDSLWRQGERFGTIGAMLGEHKLEVTTYRAEVYRPESRKPSVRFATDLETDLSRRDFTVNAMAVTLPGRELLDPFDGIGDLRRRVLRTPLDPAVAFEDDPLRMLRGARFTAALSLDPSAAVVDAMGERADRLSIVSEERIADEFMKLLSVDRPGRGLELLERTGLFDAVLPEAARQSPDDRSVDLNTIDLVHPPEPLWRLPGILAFLVADEAETVARRLRLSREDARVLAERTRSIRLASGLHTVDLAVCRRVAGLVGPDREQIGGVLRARAEALELHERGDSAERLGAAATALDRCWIELQDEDLSNLGPGLDGAQVMEELGIGQGPSIGRVMEWLTEIRIREGQIPERELRSRLRAWWGDRDDDR